MPRHTSWRLHRIWQTSWSTTFFLFPTVPSPFTTRLSATIRSSLCRTDVVAGGIRVVLCVQRGGARRVSLPLVASLGAWRGALPVRGDARSIPRHCSGSLQTACLVRTSAYFRRTSDFDYMPNVWIHYFIWIYLRYLNWHLFLNLLCRVSADPATRELRITSHVLEVTASVRYLSLIYFNLQITTLTLSLSLSLAGRERPILPEFSAPTRKHVRLLCDRPATPNCLGLISLFWIRSAMRVVLRKIIELPC